MQWCFSRRLRIGRQLAASFASVTLGTIAYGDGPPLWNPFNGASGAPISVVAKVERVKGASIYRFDSPSSGNNNQSHSLASYTLDVCSTITIKNIGTGSSGATYTMGVMIYDEGLVVGKTTGTLIHLLNSSGNLNQYGCGWILNQGEEITLVDKNANSADQSVTVWLHKNDGGNYSGYVTHRTLHVDYFSTTAQPIDTRMTFGPANAEGAIVPDPNASEGHLVFPDWKYRGGLFVGNMTGTSDKSGLGRVQIKVTSPPSTSSVGAATLAMVDRGKASSWPGTTYLGIYSPATNDPNVNQAFSALTWANRWSISPDSTPELPTSAEFSSTEDPIDFYDPPTTWGPYFANFKLTYWKDSSYNHGATSGELTRMCIAQVSEGTANTWRYFTSGFFEAPSNFGITSADFAPRLLVVAPILQLSAPSGFSGTYPMGYSGMTGQ